MAIVEVTHYLVYREQGLQIVNKVCSQTIMTLAEEWPGTIAIYEVHSQQECCMQVSHCGKVCENSLFKPQCCSRVANPLV